MFVQSVEVRGCEADPLCNNVSTHFEILFDLSSINKNRNVEYFKHIKYLLEQRQFSDPEYQWSWSSNMT